MSKAIPRGRFTLAGLCWLALLCGCQSINADRVAARERWNKARGDVQARLASELLANGAVAEAEAKLREARRLTSDTDSLVLSAGKIEIAKGAFGKARQTLDRIAPGAPERGEAEYLIGVTWLAQQKWNEAARSFDQASRLSPDDEEYVIAASQALLQSGDPSAAEEKITRWATAHGWSAALYAALAECYEQSEDWASAAEAWTKVGGGGSRGAGARTRLALALYRAGRLAEAAPLLRDELNADPEEAPDSLRMALVDCAIEDSDAGAARSYLTPLIQSSPRSPAVQRRLAQILALEHRWPEALRVLESLLATRAEDSAALELAAAIALRSGQTRQAESFAQRLRRSSPEKNPIAERILAARTASAP